MLDLKHEFIPLKNESYALLSTEERATKAIVFVHGLGGDPASSWNYFQLHVDETEMQDHNWWRTADLFFYSYASFESSIPEQAQSLLDFIDFIFPTLAPALFEEISNELSEICRELQSSAEPEGGYPPYEELYLVGHSLGAVLIREAILDRAAKATANTIQPRDSLLLNAYLRLFAPAILGAQPSGRSKRVNVEYWIEICSSSTSFSCTR